MVSVWFTADTHFNHDSMITKGWRPFSSREEMNETLIERWNKAVRPDGIVWHLGDVAMGTRQLFLDDILPRLNGKIHLIAGNHDPAWSGNRDAYKHQAVWINAGFWSVQSFARKRIDGKDVMLSHFPYEGDHTEEDRYEQYRLLDDGGFLLHGHVHSEWKLKGRQINVGVDVWDWTPVPLEVIQEYVGKF